MLAVVPSIRAFDFPSNIKVGDQVSVSCSARGESPFTFSWWKGENQLKESELIQVVSNGLISTLLLVSVDTNDTSNYTCVAKNTYGKDSHSSQLIISGEKNDCLIL